MKLHYKLLYALYLICAFSLQAATISPALTHQEVLNKITLQDRFPGIVDTLEQGRNKVTYDPISSSYSIKFDNEDFSSSVFAINPAGTVCAWDAETGLLQWRSLIIASLVTGKKVAIKESHHGKLTKLCINDTGNQFIGSLPEGLLLFDYNIGARTFEQYPIFNESFSRSSLLGMSPTGNIVALTTPHGKAALYEINKNGIELSIKKNPIKMPNKQISHVCFTSDTTLAIGGDSTLAFTNPNLSHQEQVTLTDGPIKNIWRVFNEPNSVIVVTEKDGVQEFRQVTFNPHPATGSTGENSAKRKHEDI